MQFPSRSMFRFLTFTTLTLSITYRYLLPSAHTFPPSYKLTSDPSNLASRPVTAELRRAVVFGGTGAVGREIVAALVDSPRWSSVTSVVRRKPPSASSDSRLRSLVSPSSSWSSDPEVAAALSDADSVFITLGTTRAAAGSAKAFMAVDVDLVSDISAASLTAGVPHLSICTAQVRRSLG